MKRLSLQWRITLMSALLIGITCVAMNLLLCSSGVYYMDTIADSLQGGGTVILNEGGGFGGGFGGGSFGGGGAGSRW